MSYNNQGYGQGHYTGQPGGYQYSQAPPHGYRQQAPYGQHGQTQQPPYGAPQQHFQGYPPQDGQYGAPPGPYQQQMPPHQGYGQPPPSPYGAPQSGYGAPSGGPPGYGAQGQHGAPQGQHQGYQQPPLQQPYVQPAPPSIGYDLHQQPPNVNTSAQVEGLRKAMKGMGTDEKKLIQILSSIPDPLFMAAVRRDYHQHFHRDLIHDVKQECNGEFEEALVALIQGPLEHDVHTLDGALRGAGTREDELDDVMLGRSNADLRAIKAEYQRVFHRPLDTAVRDDLSGKTERLYMMVLEANKAEEMSPVIPQNIDHDVSEIYRATEGQMGTDEIAVCQIFSSHSLGQMRAISQEYRKKYQRPLHDIVLKEFSGHMEDALVRILNLAEDPAMADATALEAAMRGAGTEDTLLINRTVRLFWNKPHRDQVKNAYKYKYKKDLVARVKDETSGDYEKLLVALLG